MNELIKVTYKNETPTVSGRELHEFLSIGTEYVKWFDRMCEYGFIEGTDYSPFLTNRSDGLPGKPKTDHWLTIPMAKEICMLQRNERGKMARQYFIRVEEAWNTPEQVMARALKFANNKIISLQQGNMLLAKEIQRQKPDVYFANAVKASEGTVSVSDLAKIMNQRGFDIGRDRLFDLLRQEGYLEKSTYEHNKPTQKSMDLGVLQYSAYPHIDRLGIKRTKYTPKVTFWGQFYFIRKFCFGDSRVTRKDFLRAQGEMSLYYNADA